MQEFDLPDHLLPAAHRGFHPFTERSCGEFTIHRPAVEEPAAADGQPAPAVEEQAAASGQPGRAVEEPAAADGQPAPAEEGQAATSGITEMDVVSIINTDEQGKSFLAPYYVFCDRSTDKSYVVSDGRITVYGDNFFPVASIGTGRGLITAAGVSVDREGNVFVPRGRYYDQATRISVYNAAFFPVRQIELSAIPDVAEAGTPRSLVIHDNGFIYVAFGEGVRGLLVLDKDGGFSHWRGSALPCVPTLRRTYFDPPRHGAPRALRQSATVVLCSETQPQRRRSHPGPREATTMGIAGDSIKACRSS